MEHGNTTFEEFASRRAKDWDTTCDLFTVDVDMEELRRRPRNTVEYMATAAKVIDEMALDPEDSLSTKYVDRNDKLLLCAFAWRSTNSQSSERLYPGAESRTWNEVIRKKKLAKHWFTTD